MTSDLGTWECDMAFSGLYLTTATGALGAVNPAVNPRVATITSGSFSNCNSGMTATLLATTRATIPIHQTGMSGSVANMYMEHLRFLVNAFGLIQCLIEARVHVGYDSATNLYTPTSTTVVRATGLIMGAGCPGGLGLLGRFTGNPAQRFTLTP